MELNRKRPVFPKRAVVTAGMPYGNKELHLGHIGGLFVHADTYARFMRDRLGRENVIFVSGTDCYGSPAFEQHRQMASRGEFNGTVEEFTEKNHLKQKEALDAYGIDIDLFAASGLGRARELHSDLSEAFITTLYKNGHLKKMSTMQFYDSEYETFLNGRQVVGKCPVCSEKGYADECGNGHQYMPSMLIDPVSTVSGKRPEMREAVNWYFNLETCREVLEEWLGAFGAHPATRQFAVKIIEEFLKPPVVYVRKEHLALVTALQDALPAYRVLPDDDGSSRTLEFRDLASRERACLMLAENHVRYRTGKTLVPFRLTGNIAWGVVAPALEGLDGLTVWVWPESLWAPISFTMARLEEIGAGKDAWKDWWCSRDAGITQFLGVDNVYFYGPAEMAMFMGYNGPAPRPESGDGELQLPELVVNNHLLFLNKKASSSSALKPPTALELLEHYTAEQLRAHFLSLGLGLRSVSFQPKAFDPDAEAPAADPVLKEGNLLTNVFNRFARTCFYTAQKYCGGRIPEFEIDREVLREAEETVLDYERLMHACEFHSVMALMDTYIRGMNKYAVRYLRDADTADDGEFRNKTLANMFHMLRTAVSLMHPIAPGGTELIGDYLNLDDRLWSWENIFEPVYFFMRNPKTHRLRFLEPRTDFFKRHPSQMAQKDMENGGKT
jgi:methionyl-tRNA synthetase